MEQSVYHGILVNKSFRDPLFPEQFELFAKNKSNNSDWVLYGVIVQQSEVAVKIKAIQKNMRDTEPWYAHLYNDEDLIVIFKNKVFYTKPEPSVWKEAVTYGRSLGIPAEQLDFHPNHFQDEAKYFNEN
jgi:hypothetical protein